MVVLWSPARVAEALRADTLSERDKLQLVVASVILADLFGSLGILYALRAPVFLVPSVLGMAITFIGLYASFRANQRGDGVRFVERLVCLGFPVSARVLTAFYGSFWLLGGVASGYWDWPNGMSRGFWAQWALVYLLATAFMWRSVRKYMELAARATAA